MLPFLACITEWWYNIVDIFCGYFYSLLFFKDTVSNMFPLNPCSKALTGTCFMVLFAIHFPWWFRCFIQQHSHWVFECSHVALSWVVLSSSSATTYLLHAITGNVSWEACGSWQWDVAYSAHQVTKKLFEVSLQAKLEVIPDSLLMSPGGDLPAGDGENMVWKPALHVPVPSEAGCLRSLGLALLCSHWRRRV